MIAKRISTIIPPPNLTKHLEVLSIRSAANRTISRETTWGTRRFRHLAHFNLLRPQILPCHDQPLDQPRSRKPTAAEQNVVRANIQSPYFVSAGMSVCRNRNAPIIF